MFIDPIVIMAGASFCAFMIGFHWARRSDEEVIASTITYLADNNFVRSFENEKGEIELLKLDE